MNYILYNDDCLNVLPNIPQNSIDMILTSPPYDNLRTYNNSCEWNFKIFKAIANNLYSVLKQGGILIWIVWDMTINGSETGTSFRQALYFKDLGLNLHDTMIWIKPSQYTHNHRYTNNFEYMFVFTKGKIKTHNLIKDRKNKTFGTNVGNPSIRNPDGTTRHSKHNVEKIREYGIRYNTWEINSVRGKERTGHPAQFPIQLANDHIISWSNEGDTVLDPFMGVGTTGIACMNLDRKFIGIEKVESYFNIAKERIESVKND